MKHVDDLIARYPGGELTEAERARVDHHIGECERCRNQLRALCRGLELLGQLPAAEPRPGLAARMAQMAMTQRPRDLSFWNRLFNVARPAAIVAAVMSAVLLFSAHQAAPEPAASAEQVEHVDPVAAFELADFDSSITEILAMEDSW